jgi:hypothetical protein
MDGVCNELFASAGFTFDENRGVGGRHSSNLIQHSTKTRARPDHAFKIAPAFLFIAMRLYILLERDAGFEVGCGCL